MTDNITKKCKYKAEYWHYGEEELSYVLELYKCSNDAVPDSDYCIFHDENYWRENPDHVRQEFYKLVEDAVLNEKELICIGFNLPDIDLKRAAKKLGIEKLEFKKDVYFDHAKFRGMVKFDCTIFRRSGFYMVEFGGEATFSDVSFIEEVSFVKAKFGEDVEFSGAKFDRVSFTGATFDGETYFMAARFGKEARFVGTFLSLGADFRGAIFENLAEFRDLKLPNLAKSALKFVRTNFKNQQNIIFDGVNLDLVSFIHTDIERVRFRNCEFKDPLDCKLLVAKEYARLDKEDKAIEFLKKVYEQQKEDKEGAIKEYLDEIKEDGDLTLDNVLTELRSFRENFDYYLKYEDSGKAFVKEMDLKKNIARIRVRYLRPRNLRDLKTWFSSLTEYLALWVYDKVALYGESWVRTLLSLVALIFLFAGMDHSLSGNDFLASLHNSTMTAFQITHELTSVGLIERLLSIPLLGLLFIALRRKYERRIRH
jgi:uncharacterized protein YjbI with pentapeptide repeats